MLWFLVGKPFARVTWASGLDAAGRPIRVPDMFPSVDGTVVAPPASGGTNWMSPAYSPRTGLFYVMAYDGEAEFFIRDEEYVEGDPFIGGGQQRVLSVDEYQSAVRAIDPRTGDRRWEYQVQPQTFPR